MEFLDGDDVISAKEFLSTIGTKLEACKHGGDEQGQNLYLGMLQSGSIVASIMTGIPAKKIYTDAIESGASFFKDGQDWKRQMELNNSYRAKFPVR